MGRRGGRAPRAPRPPPSRAPRPAPAPALAPPPPSPRLRSGVLPSRASPRGAPLPLRAAAPRPPPPRPNHRAPPPLPLSGPRARANGGARTRGRRASGPMGWPDGPRGAVPGPRGSARGRAASGRPAPEAGTAAPRQVARRRRCAALSLLSESPPLCGRADGTAERDDGAPWSARPWGIWPEGLRAPGALQRKAAQREGARVPESRCPRGTCRLEASPPRTGSPGVGVGPRSQSWPCSLPGGSQVTLDKEQPALCPHERGHIEGEMSERQEAAPPASQIWGLHTCRPWCPPAGGLPAPLDGRVTGRVCLCPHPSPMGQRKVLTSVQCPCCLLT